MNYKYQLHYRFLPSIKNQRRLLIDSIGTTFLQNFVKYDKSTKVYWHINFRLYR